MKKLFLLWSLLFSLFLFADPVNFLSKPISAGKASLTENAYSVSRLLDTANFSPELKLPVQIVYLSSVEKSGHWVFAGKRNKKGWTFTYRDYKLKSISAPSGRIVEFNYKDNKLVSVSQDGTAFIELSYSGNTVAELKINGIKYELKYAPTKLQIMPKTEKGNIISASRDCLISLRRGNLSPITFTYDDYGFLNSIKQGDYADHLIIQHQTLEERRTQLLAENDPKVRYNGPVTGRIVSDNQLKYSYSSPKPGTIALTNQMNQQAAYNFDQKTGIFQITEFSGKRYTIYYYMRYDVAYLGKIRKIVDSRGRDVINYRYDKLSGNVIRIRDMVGNDINFEYSKGGNLVRITRRAAEQNSPEPVQSFRYDQHNNLTEIALLNAQGKAVVTTQMVYTPLREVTRISDGQRRNIINYNSFGYPVLVTNIFGQTTHRELDRFNRMISSTDIYGVKTFYTYTPAGLISRIERKDGAKLLNSLVITYNGNGLPVSYTDQSGKVKKFERDAFGRVIKELFPDDTEVSYTYNKLGQLHTVLDQNRHKITFDWNKFGLDSRTTPAGQLTDYVHDKYGLLARQDSRQGKENARSIRYSYDRYDRLIKLDYGNGDVETRTYDGWGRLRTVQRGNVREIYKYDYFGRLISKIGNDEKLYLAYNPYGQRTGRFIEKDGVKMKEFRFYDTYGRLTKIVSDGKTIEYRYNSRNQIQQQIINGSVIEFTYSKYGQLKSKRMIEKN